MATPGSGNRFSLTRLLTAALFVLLLGGCATDESDGDVPVGFPTVAASEFNGRFEISSASVGGADVAVANQAAPIVSIDIVSGAIDVELICSRRLGSFSFLADQSASVTLTGGTNDSCANGADIEAALIDVFDRIDRWRDATDGFELFNANGDSLVLRRI